VALKLFVDELGKKYEQKIRVVKVDSSRNRWLCIDLKVADFPTVLIYRDGHEMDRLSGRDVNQEAPAKFVARYLAKSWQKEDNNYGSIRKEE
jgi:thioredoxin-like negative regulator of GroEL